MFESLSDRLGSVVSKLRNRGGLSEADADESLNVVLQIRRCSRFSGGVGQ
jgi:signal recognition particle GTPase